MKARLFQQAVNLGYVQYQGYISLQQLQHNTAMQYYVLMLIITLFFVFQNIGRF